MKLRKFIHCMGRISRTQHRKTIAAGLTVAGIFVCAGLLLFSTIPNPRGHDHHLGMLKAGAEAYLQSAVELPRVGWTATASDQYGTYVASNVLDGETTTIWHSAYTSTTVSPLPHSITIDMKATRQIAGLSYLPRQDSYNNGNIGRYSIGVSSDGTNWGSPVTTGTWSDTKIKKDAAFKPVNARYVRLTALSEAGNRNQWSSAAEINIMAGVIAPPALPRVGWTATASDSYGANPASNVLDGNATSIWHSQYTATGATALPHSVTVDMKSSKSIAGLSYLPRQDSYRNGTIGGYSISVSSDGTNWGSPIASGAWADNPTEKIVVFNRVTARYIRLTATTEAGNRGTWSSAAEITVRGDVPSISVGGKWDNPIGFPLVPTSAVLLANNKLLTFSAYADNTFNRTNALTRVAIMDLNTGQVAHPSTVDTDHQMFCTGLAILADGRVLIDGGSSDRATTIYNPATNTWSKGPLLNLARGYQGDTLLSNGKVLTLGGSWSGGTTSSKDGELFTPTAASGSWARLSGVSASKILTNDTGGLFRSDNHAWLFGADNGWAFHAGPSKQMHWINTSGSGSMTDVGNRADSDHAMNGNAVMYDINKILTVGGASSYENAPASARAYTIDISRGPGQPVSSARVGNLTYPRSFSNSVALPDGKVLVLGGQQYPVAFTDTAPVVSPELWDPATGQFTVMSPEALPRTYHSVAILLTDGRVFSGGGGLCGSCTVNHFNGQIFTPPYLLNADGSLRTRPNIVSAPATAKHGTSISVTTDGPTTTSFSLVRMSAVTHSVNNDQRRIPLTTNSTNNQHTLTIPSSTGIVLPGNYLLFAMDANGTPSVAKVINIR